MPIIAAVDFSTVSARAAGVAAHWAQRMGDSLILTHVVTPPPAVPHELGTGVGVFTHALKEAAEQHLEKERQALARPNIKITTHVVFGRPDAELIDQAKNAGANLLVLGTHGRSTAGRFFLGSVAERTVRHARCPVLVVPESALEGLVDMARTTTLHIVAALIPGQQGEPVRAWLRQLRERVACDVTYVHVFDPQGEHRRLGIEGPFDDLADDPELLAVLRRDLEPLTALPGKGSTRLVLRANWGRRPDPLAFEAATESADLLVVGIPTGRHFGTHPSMLALRASDVPVLCVPIARETERDVDSTVPRLTRVLVPTDFSALGNRAIPHAYQLLRGTGGLVELCHVVQAPREGLPPEEEARIKNQLQALVPLEAEILGIRTRVSAIAGPSPKDAILQAAERLAADAVVMASHGRTGVGRAVLGSVAEGVITACPKPVLVVGPQTT